MAPAMTTTAPFRFLLLLWPLLSAGCGPAIGEAWRREGFTRVENRPLLHVGGSYYVQPRIYSGDGVRPKNVLRLFFKAPDAAEPAELPFPDTYSVHPDLTPRFVGPDGLRIMVPGTPLLARGRPLLWDYLVGDQFIGHFERDPAGEKKTEFNLHAVTPLWASNNNWIAVEAFERDPSGAVYDVVLWHHLGARKMEVINLEPTLGAGGSYHFGGWSPSGKKLAVFEGFPGEEYSTGPKEVFHRILTRTGAADPRAVKLWEVQLYPQFIVRLVATRVGGWLKWGDFDPKANFFHYSWSADDQLRLDPGAKPAE